MDQLEQLLKAHDWFYQYADDNRKWKRGSEQRARIMTMVKELGPEADKLFTQYHQQKFPDLYS